MKSATSMLILLCGACAVCAWADPSVVETEVIGPFSGHDAPMHPDNLAEPVLQYYGTDLGYTYQHDGQIQILFGDSWAIESYAPIEASTGSKFDDAFGTISLEEWPDSAAIATTNIPRVKIARNPGTDEASAMNPGHAADLGKTPMHGFSNGSDQFIIYNLTKPQGCTADAQCADGQSCDTGLGYYGTRFDQEEQLTLPCPDDTPLCQPDTMVDGDGKPVPGSGFCIDKASTVYADTPAGRVAAVALNVRIGARSTEDPRRYVNTQDWLTNRFVNVTARAIDHFVPRNAAGQTEARYGAPNGTGAAQRVFLWGRPGFISVNATGRTLGLYFGFVDLPASAKFDWNVQYYTGTQDGVPQFSSGQGDAVPLDLDSTRGGVQPQEPSDLTQQMSVAWIEPLKKWVMLYGGGITVLPSPPLPSCGVLELFTRYECKQVEVGKGSVYLRTADQPWGPWTPPQVVIDGGDPAVPGSGQYGPGGLLHHPACTDPGCATHTQTAAYHPDEYGFFYAANIIEPWTRAVDGGVDIYWNVSTWDPYRVALLRTRIAP